MFKPASPYVKPCHLSTSPRAVVARAPRLAPSVLDRLIRVACQDARTGIAAKVAELRAVTKRSLCPRSRPADTIVNAKSIAIRARETAQPVIEAPAAPLLRFATTIRNELITGRTLVANQLDIRPGVLGTRTLKRAMTLGLNRDRLEVEQRSWHSGVWCR